MTAKAPTPMPEGMSRENRPKSPAAPPKKEIMEHVKELIEALPGVEFVHVSINRTYEHDKKSGLPPHSVKVYVLGGKKKQIAHILWMNKPIGVMMLGNTEVKTPDFAGYKWPIWFERLL